jgi:hypothetical protein
MNFKVNQNNYDLDNNSLNTNLSENMGNLIGDTSQNNSNPDSNDFNIFSFSIGNIMLMISEISVIMARLALKQKHNTDMANDATNIGYFTDALQKGFALKGDDGNPKYKDVSQLLFAIMHPDSDPTNADFLKGLQSEVKNSGDVIFKDNPIWDKVINGDSQDFPKETDMSSLLLTMTNRLNANAAYFKLNDTVGFTGDTDDKPSFQKFLDQFQTETKDLSSAASSMNTDYSNNQNLLQNTYGALAELSKNFVNSYRTSLGVQ